MSQSTSKILGKLFTGHDKSSSESSVVQEKEELEALINTPPPQLKPNNQLEMKDVSANILGPSSTKKYTPLDK